MFKKTFFDSRLGRPVSNVITYPNFVVNNDADSITRLRRFSETIELSENEVLERQRQGIFTRFKKGRRSFVFQRSFAMAVLAVKAGRVFLQRVMLLGHIASTPSRAAGFISARLVLVLRVQPKCRSMNGFTFVRW